MFFNINDLRKSSKHQIFEKSLKKNIEKQAYSNFWILVVELRMLLIVCHFIVSQIWDGSIYEKTSSVWPLGHLTWNESIVYG